jgi:opacity protein-like surface antigen
LRYRVTEHVAIFGEWKFNYANINHDNAIGTGVSVSADYNVHHLVFGLGYHF